MTRRYITATIGRHVKPLAQIEREAIRLAMRRYKGNKCEVAKRLRIGRSSLYRKLRGR